MFLEPNVRRSAIAKEKNPTKTFIIDLPNSNSPGNWSKKYNDKKLNIKWPIKNPVISKRDQNAITFNEFKKKYL